MNILVVDDEVAVADLLAEAVAAAGHAVRVAHDGAEGLASVGQERPDAVFLDVALPDMSGIEVLRRIRALDPRLPVILITGHAHPDEIAEAWRLGVADVVEKPNVLANLTDALAALGG